MLWSLVKVILFVLIVAALAYGGMLLLQSEGGLELSFAGYEVVLGPLQTVIALCVLLFAAWVAKKVLGFIFAFLRFLLGDETAISRYFDRNRERKGFRALSEAMLALASGEGREAAAKAKKAERYLGRPELTNLVAAQAAELNGDKHKAETVYKELIKDDRTRFVGIRGIMRQRLADGDTDTALKLAERAYALKPKHEETQDILLKLQAEKGDWAAARKTLASKLKTGNLPRDVHKRRDAVLALTEAKDILDSGKSIEAREAAIEANRKSPDLIPAAVMAADQMVAEGKQKQAARILRKSWEVQPHPDLAAAFARIAPDETPAERIKRFNALVKANPGHPETKMLLAELYIAAEDFPEARRALGDLAEMNPTARSLTILAAIERGEGSDDVVVRGWLTRALTAPRGPQWVCDNCQTVHAEWTPICDSCGAFDTLSWREPNHAEVAMPAGTEMLPMIVGNKAATPAADVAPPETVSPSEDMGVVEPEVVQDAETVLEPEVVEKENAKV